MRAYTAAFDQVNVTTAIDLFSFVPADDKPVWVRGLMIGQSSDFGDAQDENLVLKVQRGHSAQGSGGSVPTVTARDPNEGTAAGATVHACDTTIASGGIALIVMETCFNIRQGLELWLPEAWPIKSNQISGILALRLGAAPVDAITMSGTVFFEEG